MEESWRFFHIGRKYIPKGVLQSIWTQSSRLIYMWAANPRDCGETARNPIDRIRMFLGELDNVGFGDYARAAIDYMAEPLGGQFVQKKSEASDKNSVDGEIADATISMGRLASIIRNAVADESISEEELISIKDAARELRKEINQLLDAAGIEGGI